MLARRTVLTWVAGIAACLASPAGADSESKSATPSWPAPERVAISGHLVDFSCATHSYARTGEWDDTEHILPCPTKEATAAECARRCLKGGQPAALFDGESILAIFMCNARTTLADFAAEHVEIEGYWSHKDARTFVPFKIRRHQEDEWQSVSCATMY